MDGHKLVIEDSRKELLRNRLRAMYHNVLTPDVVDRVLFTSNWDLNKTLQVLQAMVHRQKRAQNAVVPRYKKEQAKTQNLKQPVPANFKSQQKQKSQVKSGQGIKKVSTNGQKSSSATKNIKVASANDTNAGEADVIIEDDIISNDAAEVISGAIPKNKNQPLFSKISSQDEKKKAKRKVLKQTFHVIKQFKEPSDRIRAYIKERIKVIVIMRGCSGTGKSTFIKKILSQFPDLKQEHHVFSADNYFINQLTNTYVFNPELLSQAHEWVEKIIQQCMRDGRSPLVIDNTNTRIWEMKPYAALAVQYGYVVETLEPPITPWSMNPNLLARKNVHGVPLQVVTRMLERYDANISGEDLLKILNLEYNPAQAPPQINSDQNDEPSKKLLNILTLPKQVQKLKKDPNKDVEKNIASVVTNFFAQTSLNTVSRDGTCKENTSQNIIDLLDLDFSAIQTNPSGIVNPKECIEMGLQLEEANNLIDLNESDSDSDIESEKKVGCENVSSNNNILSSESPLQIVEKPVLEYVLVNDDKTVTYQNDHENYPLTLEQFQKMSPTICSNFPTLSTDFDRYLESWLEDAGVKKMEFSSCQKIEENVEKSFAERLCSWEKIGEISLESETPLDKGPKEQRIKIAFIEEKIPQVCDASTNTNYSDFSKVEHLMSGGSLPEENIVVGRPNFVGISKPPCLFYNNAKPLVYTLERGTMTQDIVTNRIEKLGNGIRRLARVFPLIPVESLTELFEKCDRDLDWTVGLLLDSGEKMSEEFADLDSAQEFLEDDTENSPNVDTHSEVHITQDTTCLKNLSAKKTTKLPTGSTEDLVKHVQSSFVMNDVRKTKRGLNDSEGVARKSNKKAEDDIEELDMFEDGEEMSLQLNRNVIMMLQNEFGGSVPPNMINDEISVDLPISLARQLYSYVMDSVNQQMELQDFVKPSTSFSSQNEDEMLAWQLREEEIASANVAKNKTPNLREIMDKELALNIHKSQMKGGHGNGGDTAACRLSKQLLIERFPTMDPKTLSLLLDDTGNSLHQTVNLLMSAGHVPVSDEPSFESKVEKEKYLSREEAILQANAYKDVAQKLFQLRKEHLNKANEAYRKGNGEVALYYSEMARWHMKQINEANLLAATKLMQVNGQPSKYPSVNTLDLHFMQVRDALTVLDLFLDAHVRNLISGANMPSKRPLYIITGRGAHSFRGKSKIRPAVQARLAKRNIVFMSENAGMLRAIITRNTALSYV